MPIQNRPGDCYHGNPVNTCKRALCDCCSQHDHGICFTLSVSTTGSIAPDHESPAMLGQHLTPAQTAEAAYRETISSSLKLSAHCTCFLFCYIGCYDSQSYGLQSSMQLTADKSSRQKLKYCWEPSSVPKATLAQPDRLPVRYKPSCTHRLHCCKLFWKANICATHQ